MSLPPPQQGVLSRMGNAAAGMAMNAAGVVAGALQDADMVPGPSRGTGLRYDPDALARVEPQFDGKAITEEQKKAREAQKAAAAMRNADRDQFVDDAAAGAEGEEVVYTSYTPLKVTEGQPHPDLIVETASLAAMEPPDPHYRHHLQDCVEAGSISSAQLETIIYANDRFNQRLDDGAKAGFFLGDGAGVGKGRQIAALILEHWRRGNERILWVSVSTDLKFDAARDMEDVGAEDIPIAPKGNTPIPQGAIAAFLPQGLCFCTYSLLTSGSSKWSSKVMGHHPDLGVPDLPDPDEDEEDGPAAAPYAGAGRGPARGRGRGRGRGSTAAAATGKDVGLSMADTAQPHQISDIGELIDRKSRLGQIVHWLKGGRGSPLIIFDECHKAKNLQPTAGKLQSMTGVAVKTLQQALPEACVLYSSATGASEPANLAYMVRLGQAGFGSMHDMIKYLNGAGLGSMELYSMGLKATGCYLARTLSYQGAEFNIARCALDPVFEEMYDRASKFWQLLHTVCRNLTMGRQAWRMFWGTQMRFFRQMLMAAKVPTCAELANSAVRDGMAAVIGLQSTGEANTKATMEECPGSAMDDFVSAPAVIITSWLQKWFPDTEDTLSNNQLNGLQAQVFLAAENWKQLPPAEEAVRIRKARQAAVEAEAMGEDGVMEVTAQLDLDQVLAKRRDEAMRAGRMIDMSDMPDDEEVAKVVKRYEADEMAEAEAEMQRKLAPLRKRKEDADKALQAALDNLTRVQQEEGGKATSPREDPEDSPARKKPRRMAKAAGDSDEHLEEALGEEPEDKSPAGKAPPAAGRRKVLALDSESEDENVDPTKAAAPPAQGTPLQPKQEKGTVKKEKKPAVTPGTGRKPNEPICIDTTPSVETRSASKKASRSRSRSKGGSVNRGGSKAGASKGFLRKSGLVSSEDETEASGDEVVTSPAKPKRAGGVAPTALQPAGGTAPAAKRKAADDTEADSDSSFGLDDEDEAPRAKRRIPTRATRAGRGAQQTLAGAMARAGGRSVSLPEMVARRRVEEAETQVQDAQQEIQRAEESAQEHSPEKADADSFLADSDDMDESAGPSRSSRGRRKPKKKAKSPVDVKPNIKPDLAILQNGAAGRGQGRGATTARRTGSTQGAGKGLQYSVKRRTLDENSEDFLGGDGEEEMGDDDEEVGGRPSPQLKSIRRVLLRIAAALELPPNPLDYLTELLGGESKVAEMTGRKGLLVRHEDGKVRWTQRGGEEAQKMVNITERDRFQKGEKLIAIISEAASTGISLQADRRKGNQRRRCHLTLELPWSADKAVQQFGRSHRSNQTSAPLYRIIVSSCGGEYRFAASAAKRLQSLGALLRGDRRALGAGQNLKEFDIDNKYGAAAVKQVLNSIIACTQGHEASAVTTTEVPTLPQELQPERSIGPARDYFRFMQDALLHVGVIDKDGRGRLTAKLADSSGKTVPTFLNRMLALPVQTQALLFSYFVDVMDALVQDAKTSGKFNDGIVSLSGVKDVGIKRKTCIHTDPLSGAETYAVELSMNRGCSWDLAKQHLQDFGAGRASDGQAESQHAGFWIEQNKSFGKTGHPRVLLATDITAAVSVRRAGGHFRVMRPNSIIGPPTDVHVLRSHYKKVTEAVAKKHWDFWYEWLLKKCAHGAECKTVSEGFRCTHGMRITPLYLITGAVLPLLAVIEQVVSTSRHGAHTKEGKKVQPKVVRTALPDGSPILGLTLCKEDSDLVMERVIEVFGQPQPRGSSPTPRPRPAGRAAILGATSGSGQAAAPGPATGQVQRGPSAKQQGQAGGSRPSSGAVKVEMDLTED